MSERLSALRTVIEQILPEVDGVIAIHRGPAAIVAPHLYQKERPDELDKLALWPKEPLAETLRLIQKAHPEAKLSVVCRGCDERALVETAKHAQVNLDNVQIIGLQCTAEEAEICRCAKPTTSFAKLTVGEPIEGVVDQLTQDFAAMSREEKLEFWKEQYEHCIKCYGCRNICPECFCNVCSLEDEKWVETGRLPMQFPSMYHMIRTMHMAAKCVGCRECEETCPADIPLSIQFRLIAQDVQAMFNYETGASLDQQPPQLLVLEEGEYERTGLPH
jgi:formate dehydrogenase (coenzyme F420) beta subunit